MNDPYLGFDSQAPWAGNIGRPYELSVYAGSDGWLPHIEIEDLSSDLTFHFVRSFDDVGVYTPAYAIPDPACGVFSVPEELSVPTWMPVAIERAGFGYDPIPNSERSRTSRDRTIVHPDQVTFPEATP